jgi:hypothetical protein
VRPLVAFAAGTMAALLWTSEAVAASVTNRDDKDHKVTIMEGDARQEHMLKPAASLQGICRKGCIIRLDDSDNDDYELDGSELVSIEDGYLYYDGPEDPGEPGKGEAAPSVPGKQ